MTRFFSMKARGAFSEAYSSLHNSHNFYNYRLRDEKISGNCAPLNILHPNKKRIIYNKYSRLAFI